MASTYGDVQHLLPGNYKRLIANWLEEDCPSLDYGGFVVGESEGEARLLGKSKVCPTNPLITSMQLMDFSNRVSLQVLHSSTRSSHNLDARTFTTHISIYYSLSTPRFNR